MAEEDSQILSESPPLSNSDWYEVENQINRTNLRTQEVSTFEYNKDHIESMSFILPNKRTWKIQKQLFNAYCKLLTAETIIIFFSFLLAQILSPSFFGDEDGQLREQILSDNFDELIESQHIMMRFRSQNVLNQLLSIQKIVRLQLSLDEATVNNGQGRPPSDDLVDEIYDNISHHTDSEDSDNMVRKRIEYSNFLLKFLISNYKQGLISGNSVFKQLILTCKQENYSAQYPASDEGRTSQKNLKITEDFSFQKGFTLNIGPTKDSITREIILELKLTGFFFPCEINSGVFKDASIMVLLIEKQEKKIMNNCFDVDSFSKFYLGTSQPLSLREKEELMNSNNSTITNPQGRAFYSRRIEAHILKKDVSVIILGKKDEFLKSASSTFIEKDNFQRIFLLSIFALIFLVWFFGVFFIFRQARAIAQPISELSSLTKSAHNVQDIKKEDIQKIQSKHDNFMSSLILSFKQFLIKLQKQKKQTENKNEIIESMFPLNEKDDLKPVKQAIRALRNCADRSKSGSISENSDIQEEESLPSEFQGSSCLIEDENEEGESEDKLERDLFERYGYSNQGVSRSNFQRNSFDEILHTIYDSSNITESEVDVMELESENYSSNLYDSSQEEPDKKLASLARKDIFQRLIRSKNFNFL